MTIVCATDEHWLKLTDAMQRADLDLRRLAGRITRIDEVTEAVAQWTARCTRAEITAGCQEAQVAMAFVVTADDTLTSAGLAQALRGTVASFAVPSRRHLQREPLPTNHTHKVDKQALLALVRATGRTQEHCQLPKWRYSWENLVWWAQLGSNQ